MVCLQVPISVTAAHSATSQLGLLAFFYCLILLGFRKKNIVGMLSNLLHNRTTPLQGYLIHGFVLTVLLPALQSGPDSSENAPWRQSMRREPVRILKRL